MKISQKNSILHIATNIQAQSRKLQKSIHDALVSANIRLNTDDLLILCSIDDFISKNNIHPTINALIANYHYSLFHIHYSLKNLDSQKYVSVSLSSDPSIELTNKAKELLINIYSNEISVNSQNIINNLYNHLQVFVK